MTDVKNSPATFCGRLKARRYELKFRSIGYSCEAAWELMRGRMYDTQCLSFLIILLLLLLLLFTIRPCVLEVCTKVCTMQLYGRRSCLPVLCLGRERIRRTFLLKKTLHCVASSPRITRKETITNFPRNCKSSFRATA